MGELAEGGFEGLPADLHDAVQAWFRDDQHFTVRFRSWFVDGRSGEPVSRVLYVARDGSSAEPMVLKFLTEDGDRRANNVDVAWDQSGTFRPHLAEPRPQKMFLEGGARGILQRVAGDLGHFGPLTELRDREDFAEHCGVIIDSVVNGWNRGKWSIPAPAPTVGQLLHEVVRRRLEAAREWARGHDIPVDGDARPVRLDDGPSVPYNPFALLDGTDAGRAVQDLLIGHAHGDLSGRNILLNMQGAVDPESFVLIDYDRYSPSAPLARDPMHLLVALALDGFDRLGPDSHSPLARVLVHPDEEGHPALLSPFRTLGTILRLRSTPAPQKSWGVDWRLQCQLFLVGAALVHLGRNLHVRDQDAAKKWCFEVASLAAASVVTQLAPPPPRADLPRMPVSRAETAPMEVEGPTPIRDRKVERQELRNRLQSGPQGVSVLRGVRGVGKTKLLDVVIRDLTAGGTSPRILRHEANSVTKLDTGTLIDYLDGGADHESTSAGRSSLVRLEEVLRRLGDSPVVVAIDSAENLLSRDGNTVADPQLDRALEMLATKEGHSVTVLLVSQEKPKSSTFGTWPTAQSAVVLDSLPQEDFFAYLASMDHRGRLDPTLLTREMRAKLYEVMGGNPRHAELAHAVVVADSGFDLAALASFLTENRTPDVSSQLMRLLLEFGSDVRLKVLRTVAAFDTAVPVDAVLALLRDEPKALGALSALVTDRIVYRVDRHCYLPPADRTLIMNAMSKPERVRLYYAAARALRAFQVREPRTVDDLRLHIAELNAFLCAGEHASAHESIVEIDSFLRRWNCSHLLLEQRRAVVSKLGDEHDELENLNALADIHLRLRQFPEADEVFGRALREVVGWEDDVRAMKLNCTFAAMYWQQGETDLALGRYEHVLDQALRGDHPEVLAISREGIAKCLRRKGRHEEAIRQGVEVLTQYARDDFPDTPDARTDAALRSIVIALEVARWQGELGRDAEAEGFVTRARAIEDSRPDDRLRGACLGGLADLHLDRGELGLAEDLALRAVDLAMRHQDSVVLLQARTTLAFAYLRLGSRPDAWREIDLAAHHRIPGQSLIVLALWALAAHQQGDRASADSRFRLLVNETTARVLTDKEDFAAHDLKGYALCGLHLGGGADLGGAVEAFRSAGKLRSRAHVLADRMRLMLEQLDLGDALHPVLDVLDGR